MIPSYLTLIKMPNKNYKTYVIGQSKTDWGGRDYYRYPVPGQPRQGFKDGEKAIAFYKESLKHEEEIFEKSYSCNGSFHSDYSDYVLASPEEIREEEC